MNWLAHATTSLTAAGGVLAGDRDAWKRFEVSLNGFWASFAAIVLIAPVYLFAAAIEPAAAGQAPAAVEVRSPWRLLLILLVQWGLWPLIMYHVARHFDVTRNYIRYIIAYNWSSVIIAAIQAPPLILYAMAAIGLSGAAVLVLLALLVSLYFRFVVARDGLEVSAPMATALVLADLAISLAVNRLAG